MAFSTKAQPVHEEDYEEDYDALCQKLGKLTMEEKCKMLGIKCFYGYKLTKENARKWLPFCERTNLLKEIEYIQSHILMTDGIDILTHHCTDTDDYEIIVGIRLVRGHFILEDDTVAVPHIGSLVLRQNEKMKRQIEEFKDKNGFLTHQKARIIVHFSF